MCIKNTLNKWGSISQIFHWGMFIILIGMYSVAYIMQDMAPSDQKWELYGLHKAIGTTMLVLVAARLWWRMSNPVPKDLSTVPKWQNSAAKANVYALYILLFAFPLSGLLMSLLGGHDVNYFGLFVIPALTEGRAAMGSFFYSSHTYISYILYAFVALHIGAGLYHHFILKDSILKRMLPGYSLSEDGE